MQKILMLTYILLVTHSRNSYALDFHDYECTEDCSGHEAGYEWAEEHDITDTDYDQGNSTSFNEGVQAYAEEQVENDEDGEESEESEEY